MKSIKPLMTDAEMAEKCNSSNPACGTSRCVHNVNENGDVVIKEIIGNTPHTNFLEWFIWCAVKDTKLCSIFAECVSISESGKYLMVEKLIPLETFEGVEMPEMPIWLNDRTPSNFGRDKHGKIKILDYGMVDFSKLLNLDTNSPHSYNPFDI